METIAWSSDNKSHKDEDEITQTVDAKRYLRTSTKKWSKLNSKQISLPSAYQIAQALGKTFNGSSGFSGISTTSWVLKNLNVNSSAPYRYWTSTPANNSYGAYYVTYNGYLDYNFTSSAANSGVRPVITISKTQLTKR